MRTRHYGGGSLLLLVLVCSTVAPSWSRSRRGAGFVSVPAGRVGPSGLQQLNGPPTTARSIIREPWPQRQVIPQHAATIYAAAEDTPQASAAGGGEEGQGKGRARGGKRRGGEGGRGEDRPGKKQEGKYRHFEFLKDAARNKKKAKANKQRFQDSRDEYLEEMRTAFKLMQLKEREESGFQWVKRPKRERQIPLGELKLGERYEGVVITVKEHGCYVDFGAKRDGFVRLRDFSDVDFVLDARDVVQPGDEVTFYVKYVSPQEGIVTGSLVPADIETEEEQEARTPLADVREDDELWGEITKVSNYGAFVDVGVEVQGFLHIIYYPRRAQGALTQEVFHPGMRVRVWALEVDVEKRRLKLTGERPRTLPRVDYSWYLGGEEIDPREGGRGGGEGYWEAEEDDDDEYYYQNNAYEDGKGLQARGRGKRAQERMRNWNLYDDERSRYQGREEEEEPVVYDLDAMKAAKDAEEK